MTRVKTKSYYFVVRLDYRATADETEQFSVAWLESCLARSCKGYIDTGGPISGYSVGWKRPGEDFSPPKSARGWFGRLVRCELPWPLYVVVAFLAPVWGVFCVWFMLHMGWAK